MNLKQMKELAQIVRDNGLTSLEFTQGDTHIVLKRDVGSACHLPQAPLAQDVFPLPGPGEQAAEKADPGVDFNHVHEVPSPLVGVFYAGPSPDEKPFVSVGDKVKKGDVLCIVEAMKLMNEITADRDGEVVDICVQNGDVVEYGQTLFKLY